MRFGSVCSGIEAASVAWEPLGWKAAWLSEIEPFPSAVLKHHYPDVPNLGDMTTLPDRILVGEVEAPDLFCGGTPCQAFSVAGLRQSLNDERGNLSLTFCEIADAIDNVRRDGGKSASIIFWENVPGVLSTKDNAFGCFLGALSGSDTALVPSGRWTDAGVVDGPKRTVAWRTLDAQFFGLAQRRRRVFVVASAREGFDPAAVLFEWDGVRRDTAPSREAGERPAPTIAGCANGGGANGPGRDIDSVESLQVMSSGQANAEVRTDGGAPTLTCLHEAPIVAHTLGTQCSSATEDGTGQGSPLVPVIVGTLATNTGPRGHDAGNFACNQAVDAGHVLPVAFSIMPMNSGKDYKAREVDVAQPLMAAGPVGGNQGGDFIAQPVAFRDTADCLTSAYGTKWNGNASADNGSLFVAHPMAFHENQRAEVTMNDTAGSLKVGGGKPGQGYPAVLAPTLTASNDPSRSPQSSEITAQVAAVVQATAVAFTTEQTPKFNAEQALTLTKQSPTGGGQPQCVAVATLFIQDDTTPKVNEERAGCLRRDAGGEGACVMTPAMQVRRLTPRECERLQGFPDNYTAIPWRKKPASECPDGPRYKALGNSWAVPVVRWIGHRIAHEVAKLSQ